MVARSVHSKTHRMPRPFRLAGIVAGLVLIAFGIGAVVIGISGRQGQQRRQREQIVGTPNMKPSLIAAAVKEAGLKDVELPTCDVASKAITNGSEAECFASYMRIHALRPRAARPRADAAVRDRRRQGHQRACRGCQGSKSRPAPKQPRSPGLDQRDRARPRRSTPLFASSVVLFAIVMGIALLLGGIGFYVLAARAARSRGLRRRPEAAAPRATEPAAV